MQMRWYAFMFLIDVVVTELRAIEIPISIERYRGDKVFRVQSEENLQQLKIWKNILTKKDDANIGFIWKEYRDALDIHVPQSALPNFLKIIEEHQIHARVLIEDVADSCIHPGDGIWRNDEDFFDNYRRLESIEAYMNHLVAKNPDIARIVEIGTSWEGRAIKAIEITNNIEMTFNSKKRIVLSAGVHAREWIGNAVSLYIATQLLNHKLEKFIPNILQYFSFAIIPVVNPDGYLHTWDSDRMWRKSRNNNTLCQNKPSGVDLNRNWDFHWSDTQSNQYLLDLQTPCSDIYAGPFAFSEPEIVALKTYIEKQNNTVAYIEFHSYGQAILPPWGYTTDFPLDILHMSQVMVKAIKSESGKIFRFGSNIFSPDAGTGPDYTYRHLGIQASMTVELRDRYMYGFCLPKEEIIPSGKEMSQAIGALTKAIYDMNVSIEINVATTAGISLVLLVIVAGVVRAFLHEWSM